MKKILISLCALLGLTGSALAADKFSIDKVSLPTNTQAAVTVKFSLDAGSTCSGYTFWLDFPEQVEVVMNSGGTRPEFTLGDSYTENPTLTPNIDEGYLKVGCLNANSDPLTKQEGTLVTFYIKLKEGAAVSVGDLLTAHLTKGVISAENGSVHDVANVDFNISVVAPVDLRTVLDEDATEAPAAATGVDVRVKRSIKAGEWSTICLPFAMTAAQCQAAFGSDVQIADFTGYTYDEAAGSIAVSFSSVSAIEANHPYVIKVAEAVSEFKVDGVDVNPQDAEINKGTSRKPKAFIGNYVAGTAVDNGCLFLNGGKFWYSVGTTKIKAFRGFFNFNDLLPDFENNYAEAPRVSIVIDGMTTAIEGISADNAAPTGTYTLSGLKTERPTKKGVYIVNGKKVVVK